MTLKEKIMKLQTYKMYEGEDTVYVERDDVLKALKQQPCEDCISRQATIEAMRELPHEYNTKEQRARTGGIAACQTIIRELPSVTPQQTRWIPVSEKDYIPKNILDKIRAEIENHCGLAKEDHCRYCSYCTNLMGVREILETIDKYNAESEDKE